MMSLRSVSYLFGFTFLLLLSSCLKNDVKPKVPLTIETVSSNRGTVSAVYTDDNSKIFNFDLIEKDRKIKLTATTTYTGFVFSHWEGVDETDDTDENVAYITLSSAATVKAYFKSTATNPVAAYGDLSISGTKIVDNQGAPIQLKGMSMFWSQWASSYWNANVVNWLATDWESSVIRAAMGVDNGGYLTDSTNELSKVETVIDAAIAKGMYVIVDWHSHNAHYSYQSDDAIKFFQYIATKYGDEPNIIYELYNEPLQVSWSDIKPYLQAVTDSIRKIDPDNIILAGTPKWSQDIHLAAEDQLEGTNIAYVLHFYASETSHDQLKDRLESTLALGVPIFVSEWGVSEANGNGNFDQDNCTDWLNLLDQYDIGWCNWSVFNKNETSAALQPSASTSGNWPTTSLTASGNYVRNQLKAYGGFNTPR